MTLPPANPEIFHITEVTNLPSIISAGGLWSDAALIASNHVVPTVGMSKLKGKRLSLPVPPHPGTHVGEYVPFYFGPRSVMLFILHRGNHLGITYQGGQRPMVHLVADLRAVVAWLDQSGARWAFTLSNAAAAYTQFRDDLNRLGEVDWTAVANPDFRDPQVKESKQAEFLAYDFFPWTLVHSIGVVDAQMATTVGLTIASAAHKPVVLVRPNWYY